MKKQLFLVMFLLLAVVVQAQTVYKTNTGAKYHVQACRYLKSSIETTVAAAQAEGLSACSVCKPAAGTPGTAASAPAYNSATNSPGTGSSSGSSQCSGTTKAGTRCKRMTTSANGRCYQH